MTIEIAPKAPPAKSASSSEGTSDKKSAKESTAAHAGSPSFLALLACAENSGAGPADAGLTTAMAADGLLPQDTDLSSDAPLDGAGLALIDPALLLAQVPVAPAPEALVPAASGPNKAGAGQGKDGLLPLQGALESVLSKPLALQAKSGKAALDAAAEAAKPALGDATATSGLQAAVAASKEVLPERVHKLVQELAASLAKPADVSTLSLGVNRERSQEAQGSPRVVTQDVSVQAWAAPQGAGGAMGVDGVVAGAAASGADGQFPEQVSYWIGQDVQKAEMTLDGLGANPVEISISMQGNEATVMFRSDEALTRDALNNASAQLQDAMGRQGVVLSGVSVGTSNSGDSQRQGSGGKPSGWKIGTVEAAADSAPGGVSRSAGSGRSIDLFV
jgi:flagellar hook-length control protein FliK